MIFMCYIVIYIYHYNNIEKKTFLNNMFVPEKLKQAFCSILILVIYDIIRENIEYLKSAFSIISVRQNLD